MIVSENQDRPRNTLGMLVIALVFGGASVMLWMGRFKLAVAYGVIAVGSLVLLVLASAKGLVPMAPLQSIYIGWITKAISVVFGVAALLHAVKLNRSKPVRPWYSNWYVALLAPAALVLAAGLLLRTFFYQPFNIPSASNEPNLIVGDFIFVSKQAYTTRDPQPGETAVFKLPSQPDVDYVKRVIGMPGDRIQMKAGRLWLNGVMIPREKVELSEAFQTQVRATFYRETLPNGASYVIAEYSDDGAADNTDEYVVPADHYFTMGDNRDNTQDSRFVQQVGYIPRANFVGPKSLIWWNDQGFELSNRPAEMPANK